MSPEECRAALAGNGEFEPSAGGEWIAMREGCIQVVVADTGGSPCPLAVAKAESILQSRSYLQQRALQLVRPLVDAEGEWRVVKLDFGVAAKRAGCEFLMRFALHAQGRTVAADGAHADVGFALFSQSGEDPVFTLALRPQS
jgi:hypothetical protein